MYYRQALELQCYQEVAGENGLWFTNLEAKHEILELTIFCYFLQPSSVYIRPWHPMMSIRRLSWNVLKLLQISSSLMLCLVRFMEIRKSLVISTTGVATQTFCSSC